MYASTWICTKVGIDPSALADGELSVAAVDDGNVEDSLDSEVVESLEL